MKASLSLPSASSARRRALVYFIPGNPGVVEFYTDFLRCLRALLDKTEHATAYDIYGRNLLGFHDADHAPFSAQNPPHDLDAQVDGVWADVAARRDAQGLPYTAVLLAGHSIGAYLAVETFRRQSRHPRPDLRLRHGFLLFPTISHIARSPSGLRVTALQRSRLVPPGVEANLHRVAAALLLLLPRGALRWVWARWLGFSPAAAAALAEWLKSRDGVWQAIHLGRSELRQVREDTWEDALWDADGAGEAEAGEAGVVVVPRFFFFYGKHDHWVDDGLRDEFIARHEARGDAPGRPSIEVDAGDIAHAFCTREDTSLQVAEKVHSWVQIIDEQL